MKAAQRMEVLERLHNGFGVASGPEGVRVDVKPLKHSLKQLNGFSHPSHALGY